MPKLLTTAYLPPVSYLAAIAEEMEGLSNRTDGDSSLELTPSIVYIEACENYQKQSYSGSITLRNYMPIANSKRFAMFAELRATGAYAQSESYKVQDGKKYGTYQDIYKGSLSVVPGLCCFVTNEAALEVSVGVLGFTHAGKHSQRTAKAHQKTVQTTNQVEVSQMTQNNASFKINPLSINMGVSIFIGPNKNK